MFKILKGMLKGWKNILLVFSIVIVFALFNTYSIRTFLQGDKNSEVYNRNLFIVAGISGLIAIVIGYLIKVETVGLGLIIGGLLVILYGVIIYWFYAENIVRVIVLGIALTALIWLGYKLFDSKK